MKSRVTPTHRDLERVNQACWNMICEAQTNSNALMLIAVADFFGLGAKRIDRLSKHFDKVKKRFDEYDAEGRFKDKLYEELHAIGIDTDALYDFDTFQEVERRIESAGKPVVSIAEARGLRQRYDGFKHLFERMEK